MAASQDVKLIAASVSCFVVGFFAGYQFSTLRRKWLQWRHDNLKQKFENAKKRLDVS